MLLLSNLAVFAGVDNGPAVVKMDTAEGLPGESVHLQLHLTENPGITGLKFSVSYDKDKLELVSATYTKLGGGGLIAVNTQKNPFVLLWNVALYEFTETGVLADLTFKIKDGAGAGTSPIKMTYGRGDCIDFDLNNLTMDITNGAVKVLYNGSNCAHSWGEFTVTKEPEVGVPGEQVRACSICGHEESEPIPELEAPADTEPADTTPADTTPAETQPAETEPADTEPAETEPAETEPADTDNGGTNPPTGDEAVVLGIISAIAAALIIALIIMKCIRAGKFKK